MLAMLLLGVCAEALQAQLLSEPPLPTRQKEDKKKNRNRGGADLEWMWQYTPATDKPGQENGREHELIQDPHYRDFLEQYFTAPQSFWGSTTLDPRNPNRKSLADTVDDFLTIPGYVHADDNRYITVTGHVFRYPPGRGMLFADLNSPHPLVAFAAIEWNHQGHTTAEPDAEYTLWIFTNQPPGTPQAPTSLPPPLLRSLTRWMAEPLPGSGIRQKITGAILIDPDGTPHQIAVPALPDSAAPREEGTTLPKRKN